MLYFEKKPRLRLVFILNYVLALFVLYITGTGLGTVALISVFFAFMSYITLVKAGVLKDERANGVKDFNVDFCNCLILVMNVYEVVRYFN